MHLNAQQIEALTSGEVVAFRDDDGPRRNHAAIGEDAALTMLGMAFNRLRASAAKHTPRCAECHDDIHHPDINSRLCTDCAARLAEIAA